MLLVRIKIINSRGLDIEVNEVRIINGMIFCIDNSKREFIHVREFITCGNQLWNGAPPNFIIKSKAIKVGNFIVVIDLKVMVNISNKIIDPVACKRKYLIAPSVSIKEEEEVIIGMNIRRLISIATHIKNHLFLDNAIRILNIRQNNMSGLYEFICLNIKEKKIYLFNLD